jgi:hypothetical protein
MISSFRLPANARLRPSLDAFRMALAATFDLNNTVNPNAEAMGNFHF